MVESLRVGASNNSLLDDARKVEDCIFSERVKKSKS